MHQQTTLELILTLLSLVAHILDARQNIWARILAYPVLCVNIYVYALRNLYGKVAHSVLGLLINSYAYVQWKGSASRAPIQVTRTSSRTLLRASILMVLGILIWSFLMSKYTQQPIRVVGFDACYFFVGLLEKWMMSHKKVERWVIAFLRYTCLAIACYQSGSIILAILQLSLIIVSIYGQLKWYKTCKSIQKL